MSIKNTFASRRAFLVLDDSIRWRRLPLEAIGLWAHIEATAGEAVDIPSLQLAFPDYDVVALVDDLIAAEALFDTDKTPVVVSRPEETDYIRSEGEPRSRRVPAFVYVIEASGHFKIGITRNLDARRRAIQTGHFQAVVFVWHRRVADALALEQKLHQLLAASRVSGEWFACAREQLDEALRLGVVGHDELPK